MTSFDVDIRELDEVFEETDTFWTHYWNIAYGGSRVNGGLSTSYEDAALRSRQAITEHTLALTTEVK